jgi:molecular chaperone DnaK
MTRIKINYGIDLGTTNSSIARMENGVPTIIKTDNQKDIMHSCVAFNKKKFVLVGDSAFRAYRSERQRFLTKGTDVNSFIEFKRTMGTDKKYYSSNMDKEFSSEELSAEVLKTLKSFVTDESFNSVIITVPAKFTVNQKDATLRAAKLAGFEYCELLQEPIAASMAYGVGAKNKNGHWLVFDFGGGTFDAALLKVEEGIMKVVDTEGDNYLGGKNLDYAIVEEIMIPHIKEIYSIDNILNDDEKSQKFKDCLKFWAEEIKNQLSFKDTFNLYVDPGEAGYDDNGEEIEIDLTVNQEIVKKTISPIFQKAIDLSKSLLERNNLSASSLDSIILVGGPTYSPILRKMLEEQIIKPDTSVDPMTVVSKGAALYASTVDVPELIKEQQRDNTKIQLEFGYESTTVEEEEPVAVKILKDKTAGEIPDKIFVDIIRNDKGWSSGKKEIDENGDVIEVKLITEKANDFKVLVYNEKGDLLSSEPTSFTIIQGSKIGSAILPYNLGIEIKSRASGKVSFKSVKGLEKNQPTPATGTINGLKTQKQIRPGIKEDLIKIPLYQGEYEADGTRAIYNEHVYDVIITGEDLPKLLPEGSDVDLTIKVDKSERITLSAFFPTLDYTHEIEVPSNTTQKEIDANWLESEINKAQQTLNLIKQEGVYKNKDKLNKLETEISEIKRTFEQDRNDFDRKKQTLNNLRKSLKTLDNIQEANEWPKTEQELKDVFYYLEDTNKQIGDDKTSSIVNQFKEQIPEVIREKNIKVAKELIEQMRQLDFDIKSSHIEFWIGFIHYFDDSFDMIEWKDEYMARTLINEGYNLIANNPTIEGLRQIIKQLYNLQIGGSGDVIPPIGIDLLSK